MNKIRISGKHFQELKKHLFPGDGKEAVAVALCGRSKYRNTHTLLLKELHLIPYEECIERREDFVHWPTKSIKPLIEKAAQKGLAIMKIHCHPGGYDKLYYKSKRGFMIFNCIDDAIDEMELKNK